MTAPNVRFLDRRTAPHVVTLVILAGMSTLAMNLFLPSLPGMARWFNVDYAYIQLAVPVYLAGSAVLQLVVGPISDRVGRRPVILVALVLFIIATIAALLAPSAEWFLAARVAQAVVATGMALSRAVIRDMVPTEQAASMIGYVTMAMSVVPMIGPAIGGALDEAFGWQANFVVLALAGALTFALTWFDLGETVAPSEGGFAEQVKDYPALFASPRFWGYAMVATLASGSFFAFLGGAPFVGEKVLHLRPSAVGYYFGVPAAGYAVGNFFAGRYSAKVGIDRMILVGTILATVALMIGAVLCRLMPPDPLVFFSFIGLMTVGSGMVMPNATAGLLSVRPHLAGSASGLGGALMIGGGALLAAVTGMLLNETTGDAILLEVMAASSALSVLAIVLVIRRARNLVRRGPAETP